VIPYPGIDFPALHAASVFEPAQWPGATRSHEPAFDDAPIRHGVADDIVYVPELGLQLGAGGRVPLEAIQDPWCLGFEKERDFQGRTGTYSAGFDLEVLDDDACVLGNFYSRNFFHWISEELLKVHALESVGFQGVYVLNRLPPFARAFLDMLGLPATRVREATTPLLLRRAHYLDPITARQFDRHPRLVRGLRERLLAHALAGAPAQPPRRLWLDRVIGVNNAGRELVNPDEVYPVLARHGVERVDMGALGVVEQLRLSASASLISGPHGAGFIHVLFQAPRSDVIECYSPLFINPGVFEVCRVMAHRYAMVVHENCYGGYPHGNRLYVNPSQLELALSTFS
jgi:capsular polysaccharide biosynthesis protein